MKKIIGITSVVMFAFAMFINTDIATSSNTSLSLLDALSFNAADAEEGCVAAWDRCDDHYSNHDLFDACMYGGGC